VCRFGNCVGEKIVCQFGNCVGEKIVFFGNCLGEKCVFLVIEREENMFFVGNWGINNSGF
jgi:hypothetical protein